MRKAISFLLILSNILFVYNISKEKCDIIKCNEIASLNKGTCLDVTSNPTTGAKTWAFNKCAPGYRCAGAVGYPDTIKTYSCEEVPSDEDYIDMAKFCLNQLPGEPCNFKEQCLSKNCKKHICVGVEEGLACSKHADCAVGLYCNNSVCTLLKGLGESCTENFQCKNDAGCIDGKCVEYFTQAVGTEVKYAIQCNFNTARLENGKLICDSLVLDTKNSDCKDKDICTYNWFITNEVYTTDCKCDPSKKTQNTYCPSLLEASRPFVYTEKHTEMRFNATCDSIGRQFKTNCTGIAIYGEEAWSEISSKYIFSNIFALILMLVVALV